MVDSQQLGFLEVLPSCRRIQKYESSLAHVLGTENAHRSTELIVKFWLLQQERGFVDWCWLSHAFSVCLCHLLFPHSLRPTIVHLPSWIHSPFRPPSVLTNFPILHFCQNTLSVPSRSSFFSIFLLTPAAPSSWLLLPQLHEQNDSLKPLIKTVPNTALASSRSKVLAHCLRKAKHVRRESAPTRRPQGQRRNHKSSFADLLISRLHRASHHKGQPWTAT